MQKEAKKEKRREATTQIVGYHRGDYAQNKLFTSDRWIPLNIDYVAGEVRSATGKVYRAMGLPYKGFGLEIETECSTALNKEQYANLLNIAVLAEFPNDLFKLEDDCSLRGGYVSAEMITQIMTKEFIRNHYRDFKRMYDEVFPLWKISCSDSGNCGMHINVSNHCFGNDKATQDMGIRKLYYIVNHHYAFMCSMLRRNPSRTGYCEQMRHDKDYCKGMQLSGRYSDHGISFNLGHYEQGQGRIELRLVGGQKNFGAFRNTMETVFFLIDRVKTISWDDIDDLAKVFKGCNKYVYDRLTLARREGFVDTEIVDAVNPTVDWETEYL